MFARPNKKEIDMQANQEVYGPPIPHSHAALHAFEALLAEAKSNKTAAARTLGALWDRQDAGERGLEDQIETARLSVCIYGDQQQDAHQTFVREWKRVGCPQCDHGCTR